jgi:hypothetical protein
MKVMTAKDRSGASVGGATNTVNPRALELKDACQYLGGISATSVRRLVKRQLLRPNRALRHNIFSIAELDRFLEGQQQ